MRARVNDTVSWSHRFAVAAAVAAAARAPVNTFTIKRVASRGLPNRMPVPFLCAHTLTHPQSSRARASVAPSFAHRCRCDCVHCVHCVCVCCVCMRVRYLDMRSRDTRDTRSAGAFGRPHACTHAGPGRIYLPPPFHTHTHGCHVQLKLANETTICSISHTRVI